MRVECPHCGAGQSEPVLAVSTFCKNCGEHFKLSPSGEKKGGFGFFGQRRKNNRSVLQPAFERTDDLPKPALRKVTEEDLDDPFAIKPAEVEVLPTRPGDGQTQKVRTKPVRIEPREDSENENSTSAHGRVDSSFEAKKRDPKHREVPCVDCGTPLYVSEAATSTQCHRCSAYVSLEDMVLKTDVRENVKIRGNLTIQKRGSLVASQIICNNLSVFGTISGKIDCAGSALFRSSGKVFGSMRCKHLIVHKASKLEFVPGIRAESADIDGQVTGDIFCEKIIRISKTGAVVGGCTAPAVVLEDGGTLSGQMRFMKPDSAMEAEYARRAKEASEEFIEESSKAS